MRWCISERQRQARQDQGVPTRPSLVVEVYLIGLWRSPLGLRADVCRLTEYLVPRSILGQVTEIDLLTSRCWRLPQESASAQMEVAFPTAAPHSDQEDCQSGAA